MCSEAMSVIFSSYISESQESKCKKNKKTQRNKSHLIIHHSSSSLLWCSFFNLSHCCMGAVLIPKWIIEKDGLTALFKSPQLLLVFPSPAHDLPLLCHQALLVFLSCSHFSFSPITPLMWKVPEGNGFPAWLAGPSNLCVWSAPIFMLPSLFAPLLFD